MKSFTTLTKKLALTVLATSFLLIAAAIPSAAADQNQQSSQGQFSQGNFYYVKDETQNGAWGNTISANACDELRYKIYLYNPGPSFLSSATIQVSLPSNAAASNTSTATAYSINADPTTVSANAVVNLNTSESITYESGSTELLDANNNVIKDLPDGITQGGVNIGDIAASGTEFVQFNAKVNCPPQQTPCYTCTDLGLTAEDNRTVKISNFATTQMGGATYTSAVIDWGDNTTETFASPEGQTHQYAANGTYTVTATANFNVGGQNKTATGVKCAQSVTFSATTPPTVTPPVVTPPAPAAPTTLVNTGPGSAVGLFAATTLSGAAFYRRLLARRLSRQ
jgi:hypothetical protein